VSAEALARFLRSARSLFVITGAGCSAPSGIDTYRDDSGTWRRSAPIQHQEFMGSSKARQRYWARSMRGWPMFRNARPNPAHDALADLEASGRLRVIVTQNVDGLHQRAGSRKLIELHGSLAEVVCMDCERTRPREELQGWLEKENGAWLSLPAEARPDGDADLVGQFDDFAVPECVCGGILKPDVVFYGDSVPRRRVDHAREELAAADALLVVGSSLMVFSSFRFLREARELALPMAAVNLGKTRADDWFGCKLQADGAVALPELVRAL
jgi:NAD-dependent SIR2 family protein deacetylase